MNLPANNTSSRKMAASSPKESEKSGSKVQQPTESTQEYSHQDVDITEYVAPYYPNEGVPRKPNRYLVTFFKEHTLDKHRDAIGEHIRVAFSSSWYSATLTDEKRERIRRDPGVKDVRQIGSAEWG